MSSAIKLLMSMALILAALLGFAAPAMANESAPAPAPAMQDQDVPVDPAPTLTPPSFTRVSDGSGTANFYWQ